jgi:hypothetical protein
MLRLAVGVEHEYGSCIPPEKGNGILCIPAFGWPWESNMSTAPPEKGNGILCMKKEMGFCAVPSLLHAEIPPEKGNGILCSSIPPAC